MNQVVIFNNKTSGRDKLARLIQYASKVAWYILKENNAAGSSVDKFANLEYLLSNFRRILRLGRCLDTLYSAMNLIHHDDKLISFNCAISKIAYSMFLLCDHIIWFGRAGLADIDTSRWNRIANKYWLFTIVINLARDYFEIKRLLAGSKMFAKCKCSDPKMAIRKLIEFSETHKDVVLDLVKNSCDIFIPLAALNYVNLSPATIGMFGVVSSIVGIYTVVDPFAKLPLA
ncbi:peroxisomal membrane protein 11B [Planococcus citri]|uniref:peroxisomal membrane protein 11B n=1 Tax=Planococcus citri TaxID=170843 RepID=UPI0031F9F3F1